MTSDFRMSTHQENIRNIPNIISESSTTNSLVTDRTGVTISSNKSESLANYRGIDIDQKFDNIRVPVLESVNIDSNNSGNGSDSFKNRQIQNTIDEASFAKNENLSDNRNQKVSQKDLCNKIPKDCLIDLITSLCSPCDICDNRDNNRVIRLKGSERIIGAVILKKIYELGLKPKKIIRNKIPEQTCPRCFSQIVLFHNRHKHKLIEKKYKNVAELVMDPTSHGYSCSCDDCQNQYGDLPILLEGIEEQNKIRTSHSQSETKNILHGENILDISHSSQNIISYQSSPVVTCQAGSFEQPYDYKNEDDFKSFRLQYPDHYQLLSNSTEQNYFCQSPDMNQPGVGYQTPKISYEEQNDCKDHYQGASQYYSPATEVARNQMLVGSSSSLRDHLPISLEEFESTSHPVGTDQPSTSSGIQTRLPPQGTKETKKIMSCVHCDKKFTHKGDFNKHLRKHTKERPYKCVFCNRMFSNTSNLHRHRRIHSGDRPFRCQHCDKCFNRKDKLESHKNSKFCRNRRCLK